MTLIPGQTIGPYRVVEQIGRGGMATVYKAHQPALDRFVALKVLPAHLAEDPGFRERFRAEAVTIAQLRHPNILHVFDYGAEEGLHYLVTEFVDAGTLADRIGTPLSPDYVTGVLRPIAAALDYAHGHGVVHRDVKPSNVLLEQDGTPVLSDFGLARMLMSALPRLTRTGAVVGTPEYMAPEQAVGEEAGAPADRYALAVIAYELLTGSVPFSAETPLATLLAHAHQPLPLPRAQNPRLTPGAESVLLKGLAKRPADRYPSATTFVDALSAALVGTARPARREMVASWASRIEVQLKGLTKAVEAGYRTAIALGGALAVAAVRATRQARRRIAVQMPSRASLVVGIGVVLLVLLVAGATLAGNPGSPAPSPSASAIAAAPVVSATPTPSPSATPIVEPTATESAVTPSPAPPAAAPPRAAPTITAVPTRGPKGSTFVFQFTGFPTSAQGIDIVQTVTLPTGAKLPPKTFTARPDGSGFTTFTQSFADPAGQYVVTLQVAGGGVSAFTLVTVF